MQQQQHQMQGQVAAQQPQQDIERPRGYPVVQGQGAGMLPYAQMPQQKPGMLPYSAHGQPQQSIQHQQAPMQNMKAHQQQAPMQNMTQQQQQQQQALMQNMAGKQLRVSLPG